MTSKCSGMGRPITASTSHSLIHRPCQPHIITEILQALEIKIENEMETKVLTSESAP